MGYVTTDDGIEIYYKDWAPRTRRSFFSIMAGR